MSDIRIDHGSIITMDPDRQILTDASLVIEGDRIKAIGPTNALASAFPAAKVIDAGRMAVLPGLIDAHAHAGHSLIRSMGGEDNAEWYRACDTVFRFR
jgi:5-methylthioadenosine/S-adenosylhomocysteine deaminase